jgi:glycosyltransferase involved in cell wall biosynthesis
VECRHSECDARPGSLADRCRPLGLAVGGVADRRRWREGVGVGRAPAPLAELQAGRLWTGAYLSLSDSGGILRGEDGPRAAVPQAETAKSLAMDGRKPTICHLLDRSNVVEAETLATQLARQFQSNYHFTFICLGEASPLIKGLDLEDAPVHSISRRPGLDWNCSRRLGRLLRREKVDLLHAHQSGAFIHGMIARLFYRHPPVLFTEHERRYPDAASPKRVVVNRMLLEGRDQIVAASQSVRQALILNEGLPPEQVKVIYNGIVPTPVTGAARDGRSLRREIGVDADALLILQLARFDPWQNHTLAIRTLEQVVRNLPKARLALVGEGPDLGMIQELVRQRGLGSHVLLLGPRADHARLLMAADLVLLTGLCEGVPPVLIQALASGRPVVATRVGGVSEIVEDRVCGLLACPGDYGGLADNIHRLGASPELREQFGRQGQKRIEALLSEADTSLLYSNVYRSMLSH